MELVLLANNNVSVPLSLVLTTEIRLFEFAPPLQLFTAEHPSLLDSSTIVVSSRRAELTADKSIMSEVSPQLELAAKEKLVALGMPPCCNVSHVPDSVQLTLFPDGCVVEIPPNFLTSSLDDIAHIRLPPSGLCLAESRKESGEKPRATVSCVMRVSFPVGPSVESEQTQFYGELLYPLVLAMCGHRATYAPKITGMFLELAKEEIEELILVERSLRARVEEAFRVLEVIDCMSCCVLCYTHQVRSIDAGEWDQTVGTFSLGLLKLEMFSFVYN